MSLFVSDEKFLMLDTSDEKLESSLNNWLQCQNPIKKIQCLNIIKEDVRVLIDETGFTAFFPPELWKKFDIQVKPYLKTPVNTSEDCWIAKQGYRYVKLVVHKDYLPKEAQNYASDDLAIKSQTICDFFNVQFITNNRAYADGEQYSIGYQEKYPNGNYNRIMRILGNFVIKF
jgi:hypothetical protein